MPTGYLPLSLSLAVTLLGCAAAPSALGPPSETSASRASSQRNSTASVAMAIKTLEPEASAFRYLAPGAPMPSGSEFLVQVETTGAVYVYVAQQAGGKLAWLWPQGPEPALQIQPNQVAQLPPESGRWFKLDRSPGAESLLLFASVAPRSPAELEATLNAPAGATKLREPPPLVPENKRGLVGEHVLRRALPADGLAILRFDYQHR